VKEMVESDMQIFSREKMLKEAGFNVLRQFE
jgi:hypothetical protein